MGCKKWTMPWVGRPLSGLGWPMAWGDDMAMQLMCLACTIVSMALASLEVSMVVA